MSNGVVFENEESSTNKVGNIQIVSGAPTGILAWLVKAKVAKDGKEAERLLLGITIGGILLAVGVLIFAGHTGSNSTPASKIQSDVLRMEKMHFTPTTQ